MLMHNAYILVLEGLDSSGKTVVAKEVYDIIKKSDLIRNSKSLILHSDSFPNYNSISGSVIRKLLNSEITLENRGVLASLFALDRHVYNLENKVSELGPEHFFIFNRSWPSNFAYNYEIGLDKLTFLEQKSFFGDKIIILDIDPEISFKRRQERRDNYENNIEYLVKVRSNYLELAKKFHWIVIDGHRPTKVVAEDVINLIMNSNSGITGDLKPHLHDNV